MALYTAQVAEWRIETHTHTHTHTHTPKPQIICLSNDTLQKLQTPFLLISNLIAFRITISRFKWSAEFQSLFKVARFLMQFRIPSKRRKNIYRDIYSLICKFSSPLYHSCFIWYVVFSKDRKGFFFFKFILLVLENSQVLL